MGPQWCLLPVALQLLYLTVDPRAALLQRSKRQELPHLVQGQLLTSHFAPQCLGCRTFGTIGGRPSACQYYVMSTMWQPSLTESYVCRGYSSLREVKAAQQQSDCTVPRSLTRRSAAKESWMNLLCRTSARCRSVNCSKSG